MANMILAEIYAKSGNWEDAEKCYRRCHHLSKYSNTPSGVKQAKIGIA